MHKALRVAAGLGLVAGLAACGHSMSLRPLDGGLPARGGTLVSRAPVEVRIDGKLYRGRVTEAPLNPAEPPPAPVGHVIQVGRYPGQRGAGGAEVAQLRARDGSTLVCRFRHDPGEEHGSGLCRTDAGRTFSLAID